MATNSAPPSPPASSRRLWWIAGGAAALALAFAVGRISSEPEPRPRTRPAAPQPQDLPPEPSPPGGSTLEPQAAAPAAVQLPSVPPPSILAPPTSGPIPPEYVQQYQAEMLAHVEENRDAIVEKCVPRDGFPGGQRHGTITYSVSFDANGNEVARGLVDDRRAPVGPAFGRCLQVNRGRPFKISPPGRPVSLRITVTYP